MTFSALILDLILLAILIAFAIRGASRGLLLSLCGLVAMLVAFAGAGFVADLLAPRVADYLEPRFASAIEERLETQLEAALPDGEDPVPTEGTGDIPLTDLLDVLRDMGLYQSAVDAIDRAVAQGMTDVAADAAAAVAASIAGSVAYMILFVVSFVVILVLWTLLSHALDLVARLPGLHALNRTGGALLGLVKGCAILFLCAWVLRYLGSVIPEETVEQTYLLKFFLNTNPVTLILDGIALSAALSA